MLPEVSYQTFDLHASLPASLEPYCIPLSHQENYFSSIWPPPLFSAYAVSSFAYSCDLFLFLSAEVTGYMGIAAYTGQSSESSERKKQSLFYNSHFISLLFFLGSPVFSQRLVGIPTGHCESISSQSPYYIPALSLKSGHGLFVQWVSVKVRKFEKKMDLYWCVSYCWRADQQLPEPL